MDAFALDKQNPQFQALQRGLVQQLPNAKGVTNYLDPKTGQVGISNDPNSAPWWAPYFKGLVSSLVGAGFGAAGGAAFGAGGGAADTGLAVPVQAQGGWGATAAAPDASSVLSAAANTAPENITITGNLAAAQPGWLTQGLTTGDLVSGGVTLGGAGEIASNVLGSDAAPGTLVDPQGNVLAQPGSPEQVSITGQIPQVAASGIPDIGSILTTGGLAGLSAEALGTFGGGAAPSPAPAPSQSLFGNPFGSSFATPSGVNWTPGPGGFPTSGYTDTGGFGIDTGATDGGLFKDFTWRDALGAAGLGATIGTQLGSKKNLPGEAQIQSTAANLGTQGQALSNYLTSGTLPPGVHQSLNHAATSAKAALRSKFASMGMSGSTSEAQALGDVDMQAATQGTAIAMNLLNSGIQESQLSAELYNMIMNSALSKDQQLGSAIGNFSAALAGLTPTKKAA